MSFKIKENLSGIVRATTNKNPNLATQPKAQVGKVYGVVLDDITPSNALFLKAGGYNGIGSIFYQDYNGSSNNTNGGIIDLNTCKIAKPFHANMQNFPLIGELVELIDGPSPASQISTTTTQKYYTGVLNIWNNVQHNSPDGVDNNKTFIESSDVRNLAPFAGDIIYQGRKGAGIRFGSTVKLQSDRNEWSSAGEDGDPITILVNGYVTTDTGSLVPNVEEINKEKSSIYMTTTQAVPLMPGTSIINKKSYRLNPKDYNSSQIILNSDRITLNSKKDEILLFSNSIIELNTDSNININAGKIIHLHVDPTPSTSTLKKDPKIFLGTKEDGSYPSEPVLLGGATHDVLLSICSALASLANSLSTVSVATSDGDILISECNTAGEQLADDIENILEQIDGILSQKVYTV
jgi:hypothetical protein